MKKAKIEIHARPVANVPASPTKGAPHHLFIVHTTSDGEETILRGGTETQKWYSTLIDDIKIIKAPYNDTNKKQPIDYVKNAPRVIIAEGTDAEMQTFMDRMWSKAEEINKAGYDYKLPFLGHLQNGNTAIRVLVDYAGEVQLPKYHYSNNHTDPGI